METNEIKTLVKNQKQFFRTGETHELNFRIKQLKNLKNAIKQNEDEILTALKKDLNKSPFEAFITEIAFLYEEIDITIKKLKKWIKPKKVKTPITSFPAKSYIIKEPYGVSLIIAPWNYPFQLVLAPLIGAIASGNCAVLKTSEYAVHTSSSVIKLIEKTFDSSYISAMTGGVEVSQTLLKEQFDHIFFTGSVPVGKIVMKQAAEQLIPVTLELGGKSPVIVDDTVDLKLAAKRIAFGKFLNTGQTCVAPDYILVHERVKSQLITELQNAIRDSYGEDAYKSEDYGRIINDKQYNRLTKLLNSGGKIVSGGMTDSDIRYIEPTIIDDVTFEHEIMKDEIFGPLLPILSYSDLNVAIRNIQSLPKPLALYLFTNDKKTEKRILREVSFGGGCVNDTLMHLANPNLPFGGVGSSGLGAYHGETSIDAFSHEKSILKKANYLDISFRYPPYKSKIKWLRRFFK
ncbi:aldehyde dehydrogenase [Haloplasma contractile]|uniref:Aldehyde dehydrogenase n=1 Tax=Haloplasma contractile SSD-17B TaxID=1033810 RepID=U2E9M5_9MOLU|nr:aldehyde dehydrogenase [Haloplasma contractile]ERJ11531.1 Aldehyde dehydrogenase protein [Haloplasma contractile SSD-17B]